MVKKDGEKKKKVVKKESEKKHKKNGIVSYFKGVFKEVKRIRWTSGKDLLKYSVATLIFVLFFGIYFYGIDWIALIIRSLIK